MSPKPYRQHGLLERCRVQSRMPSRDSCVDGLQKMFCCGYGSKEAETMRRTMFRFSYQKPLLPRQLPPRNQSKPTCSSQSHNVHIEATRSFNRKNLSQRILLSCRTLYTLVLNSKSYSSHAESYALHLRLP